MKLICGTFLCMVLMRLFRAAPIKHSFSNFVDSNSKNSDTSVDHSVDTLSDNLISLDNKPLNMDSAMTYDPLSAKQIYTKLRKLREAHRKFAGNVDGILKKIKKIRKARKMIDLIMNPQQTDLGELDILNLLKAFNDEQNITNSDSGPVNDSLTPQSIVRNFFKQVNEIVNSTDPIEFEIHFITDPREITDQNGHTTDVVYDYDLSKDVSEFITEYVEPEKQHYLEGYFTDQNGDSTKVLQTGFNQPKTLGDVLKGVGELLRQVNESNGSTNQTNANQELMKEYNTVRETFESAMRETPRPQHRFVKQLHVPNSQAKQLDVPDSLTKHLHVPAPSSKQLDAPKLIIEEVDPDSLSKLLDVPSTFTKELDPTTLFSMQLEIPGYNFMRELPGVPFAIRATEQLHSIERSYARRKPLRQDNYQFLNMVPRYHCTAEIKRTNLVKRVKMYLEPFQVYSAKVTEITNGLIKFVSGKGTDEFLFSIISPTSPHPGSNENMKALFVHYKKQESGNYLLQKLEFNGKLNLPATFIITRLINPDNDRWMDVISYMPMKDTVVKIDMEEFLNASVPDLGRILSGFGQRADQNV